MCDRNTWRSTLPIRSWLSQAICTPLVSVGAFGISVRSKQQRTRSKFISKDSTERPRRWWLSLKSWLLLARNGNYSSRCKLSSELIFYSIMLNSDKSLLSQEAHSHLKRGHIHFLVWVEEGTQRQFGVQLINLVEESLYLVFGFVLV